MTKSGSKAKWCSAHAVDRAPLSPLCIHTTYTIEKCSYAYGVSILVTLRKNLPKNRIMKTIRNNFMNYSANNLQILPHTFLTVNKDLVIRFA